MGMILVKKRIKNGKINVPAFHTGIFVYFALLAQALTAKNTFTTLNLLIFPRIKFCDSQTFFENRFLASINFRDSACTKFREFLFLIFLRKNLERTELTQMYHFIEISLELDLLRI